MEITLKPEDIFEPKFKTSYEADIQALSRHLMQIKNNLVIMRRIYDFPLQIFTDKDHSHFWQITSSALVDSSMMAISRMMDDKGEKGNQPITIKNARTQIQKHLKRRIEESKIEELNRRFEDANFDKQIHHLYPRTKALREKFIGDKDYELHLQELENVIVLMEKLFHVIALSIRHPLLNWAYANHESQAIDIDEILEDTVKHSYWIDLGNQRQIDDDKRKKKFLKEAPENQEIINQYRQKFGLAEF